MSCCVRVRKPVPYVYQPETVRFLTYVDIAIPNDGTVYHASTIYQITGAEIWAALDLYFISEKVNFGLTLGEDNLGTIYKYFYPRIGGTALMHSINAIDPSQFQGTFNGGWTHSGAGATGNATNSYFDTNCNGMANINGNNHTFSIDCKTNANGTYCEVFCADGTGREVYMFPRNAGSFLSRSGDTGTNYNDAVGDSLGKFTVSRNNNTNYKTFKEGVLLASHTQPSAATFANTNVLEGGLSASVFSGRTRTGHWGGIGQTDTQVLNSTIAWRAFETTLNR